MRVIPPFPSPFAALPIFFVVVVLYRNPVHDRTGKKLNKLWLLHRSGVGAGLGHVVLVGGKNPDLVALPLRRKRAAFSATRDSHEGARPRALSIV